MNKRQRHVQRLRANNRASRRNAMYFCVGLQRTLEQLWRGVERGYGCEAFQEAMSAPKTEITVIPGAGKMRKVMVEYRAQTIIA